MSLRGYWKAAREPRYAITFALPLVLLYEGLLLLVNHSAVAGVRNGADVLLKTIFIAFGGRRGLFTFGVVLCGVGGWLVWNDRRQHGPIRRAFLGLMLLESAIYAVLLGIVVSGLTALLLRLSAVGAATSVGALPLDTQLVVSLGAGIYEELLFRVLIVSGLTAAGVALGMKRSIAVGGAVMLSALIFSAFHYIGPYGDVLTKQSFTFRMIAGIMFSGLYVARGFGITAWTHALYDVALALLLA